MIQPQRNTKLIFFLLVLFMIFGVIFFLNDTTVGEVAKLLKVESNEILIRNQGGQEKYIKVSKKDLENLEVNKTYFVEYRFRPNLGGKPRLLEYELIPGK